MMKIYCFMLLCFNAIKHTKKARDTIPDLGPINNLLNYLTPDFLFATKQMLILLFLRQLS